MKHPTCSPYREAAQPPLDEEVVALARLAAKAQRARRLVGVPILLSGVALAVAGYLGLRGPLFQGIDARAPYLTILVTAFPLVVLAQAVAAAVARKAVVFRSPAWIAEITAARGSSPALLEAFIRSL